MALSKLAIELLGIRSVAAAWKIVGEGVTCQLYTEASAAVSKAKRYRAGNMRHINGKSLWLQEKRIAEGIPVPEEREKLTQRMG